MTKQDDFISTVSHELRTPLTSIRGFAQTMLSSWDKLDDNSKKRFLEIIEQQSNRLIHLVENILSVTKIPDENLILKKTDVNSAISSVMQIIRQKYNQHTFELNLKENISNISADYERLQQVFINIIENACKYSEEGSVVKKGTENEELILKTDYYSGKNVKMSNSDTTNSDSKLVEQINM